jgi:hypothetical protein
MNVKFPTLAGVHMFFISHAMVTAGTVTSWKGHCSRSDLLRLQTRSSEKTKQMNKMVRRDCKALLHGPATSNCVVPQITPWCASEPRKNYGSLHQTARSLLNSPESWDRQVICFNTRESQQVKAISVYRSEGMAALTLNTVDIDNVNLDHDSLMGYGAM